MPKPLIAVTVRDSDGSPIGYTVPGHATTDNLRTVVMSPAAVVYLLLCTQIRILTSLMTGTTPNCARHHKQITL